MVRRAGDFCHVSRCDQNMSLCSGAFCLWQDAKRAALRVAGQATSGLGFRPFYVICAFKYLILNMEERHVHVLGFNFVKVG